MKDHKTVEDLLLDKLFLRYYFGRDEEDIDDWLDWQDEHPSRRVIVKQAFKILDTLSLKFDDAHIKEKIIELQERFKTELPPLTTERDDTTTKEKIIEWQESSKTEPEVQPVRFRRFTVWRVAASVAVLVTVGVFFGIWKARNPVKQETNTLTIIENREAGKIKIYTLQDGSKIRLNVGSYLRLDEGFNKTNRDVFLKGEAYFEVKKSPMLPFRVYTEGSITTAIGTAFSVRALAGEKVKVILVEGKVRVQNTQRDALNYVELKMGQEAVFEKTDLPKVEEVTNVAAEMRWTQGYVLTFRETSFAEVCQVLSENYHVVLNPISSEALKQAKITAEFDRSLSLEEIMDALAFANKFNYSIHRDTIKIF
jgi:ferric-dicitrate binding protein FerR (iron transport regulator)